MFYKEPRYDSWGVSLPKFGKKLMQSMSLSLEEVQNYLSAQEIEIGTTASQSENYEDEPRVTVVFEILGATANVASFVPPCPTRFPPDVWVVFEVPKVDKFDRSETGFRGIATTQVEDGDYVHCAVDSDVALIVRHKDGYREIESWAIVKTDPNWKPQEVDLDRVWALHDGRNTGQFESLSEHHAHFFRLTLRPRNIMRVRLPVAVALIQGSDEPHKRYIEQPSRESTPNGPPNWRGYEWPVAYWWLVSVRRRWRKLVRSVQRAFWSLRWRLSFVRRDSVSARRDSVSIQSEPFTDSKTEEPLRGSSRYPGSRIHNPISDEMVRAIADTWQRSAESARI